MRPYNTHVCKRRKRAESSGTGAISGRKRAASSELVARYVAALIAALFDLDPPPPGTKKKYASSKPSNPPNPSYALNELMHAASCVCSSPIHFVIGCPFGSKHALIGQSDIVRFERDCLQQPQATSTGSPQEDSFPIKDTTNMTCAYATR